MTFPSLKNPGLTSFSTKTSFPQVVIIPVFNHSLLLHNILLSEPFPVLMSLCSFSTHGLVLSESVPIYRFIYISNLTSCLPFTGHFVSEV